MLFLLDSGLKMMVGSINDVQIRGSHTYTHALTHSFTLTHSVVIWSREPLRWLVVVLAIWATKLLLKAGPNTNYASRVGEVGRQDIAFTLCSTHYLEP